MSALTAAPHEVLCVELKIHGADIKEISIVSTQLTDGAVLFIGELCRSSLKRQTNLVLMENKKDLFIWE